MSKRHRRQSVKQVKGRLDSAPVEGGVPGGVRVGLRKAPGGGGLASIRVDGGGQGVARPQSPHDREDQTSHDLRDELGRRFPVGINERYMKKGGIIEILTTVTMMMIMKFHLFIFILPHQY